ncbi:hypothetical protein [Shinella sumterensis]|uniref:hypothetical protein n=1 Tax=Shinella sumterensis TaxID=1967501 RepID=UPI00106DD960|nr:hypothetical protein [Shinella sumterensis]MCD1266867.1 hypothetical protein [Shinella sumterensis]
MNKDQLLVRRAGYQEELDNVLESLALYENGRFTMHGRTGDGPFVDMTAQMRDQCHRTKATLERIISELNERIAAL